jgi:hypothetical protein
MRTTVATMSLAGLLALGALAGTAVATAQGGAEQSPSGGTSPEALVDRLVELERQLPPLPPGPEQVILDDETTFGDLQGDFFSAQSDLDLISDQARQLFVDADDADGPVADAVASVARSYLELQQGYRYLAGYKDYDLSRPLGESDDDGVATGADEAAGLAETGVRLVVNARLRAITGYDVLRDDAAADDTEKGLFDAAFRDAERFLLVTRPQLHELLSLPTVGLLVVIDRFDPLPGQAHAKDLRFVCVDRSAYPGTAEDVEAALLALFAEGLQPVSSSDCPALPEGNTATAAVG